MPIIRGDDSPRLVVPGALVQVLTALLETEEYSHRWAELRTMRTRLCKLYGLPDPAAPANSSDVAQMMEDADGIPIEE